MNKDPYEIDENEMSWHDVFAEPKTDEQKYGSADRPPKFWYDIVSRYAGMNRMSGSLVPKHGLNWEAKNGSD